ncbi:MAG: urease accessory protein UreF [Cyanobacteria bacterium P01_D01_bin.128]
MSDKTGARQAIAASDSTALLRLLQLASPTLPVGAYTYSEGLETLVQSGLVQTVEQIEHWLQQELICGAVRIEAAIVLRAYRAKASEDWDAIAHWNHWLSAARETAELRQQSWQMGRSLVRLIEQLHPELAPKFEDRSENWNFAVAFGLTAAHWQISEAVTVLGYLQSWASNLINAAVRLVPLGQTAGQRLLLKLSADLEAAANNLLTLADDDLTSSGWGLAIASMQHETLYSRLFRS